MTIEVFLPPHFSLCHMQRVYLRFVICFCLLYSLPKSIVIYTKSIYSLVDYFVRLCQYNFNFISLCSYIYIVCYIYIGSKRAVRFSAFVTLLSFIYLFPQLPNSFYCAFSNLTCRLLQCSRSHVLDK